jgi:phage virion morphogenesis protein
VVGFKVDASKAFKDLNAWMASLKVTGLEKCAAYMALLAQEDSKKSIRNQHGPEGEGWPARKERKPAKGQKPPKSHKLLWLTGALFRSLTGVFKRTADGKAEVLVVPSARGGAHKYAGTHQFGDPHRHIPARPYAGVTRQSVASIKAFIAKHLLGGGG